MQLSRLFSFVKILLILGIVIAFLSMFLPFKTTLPAGHLEAAGALAAAIASMFGLGIASLALIAYVSREEVGRELADKAWIYKQDLERALHQFSVLIQVAYEEASRLHISLDDEYEKLLQPALEMLLEALRTARNSELYRAIDGAEGDAGNATAQLILLFEALIQHQLKTGFKGIDTVLVTSFLQVRETLLKITKADIYDRIHCKLSPEPFEFMGLLADNIKNVRAKN